VLFTILVTPSNVIAFVTTASGAYRTFATAAKLANFFLLSNFAVNFVLYLVINAEFRRVTRDLVTCRCIGQRDVGGGVATGNRSLQWRSEAGRRAAKRDEMRFVNEAGGSYSMCDTIQRNPDIVVTEDTNIYNFSETEIAL